MKINHGFRSCCVLMAISLAALAARANNPPRLAADWGQRPLQFEANQGQTDAAVKFLSRGSGHTLFLTPTEAVLVLRAATDANPNGVSVVRVKLVGANPSPEISGLEELPGHINYYHGSRLEQTLQGVPRSAMLQGVPRSAMLQGVPRSAMLQGVTTYARVKYHAVYPGVDLVYYGNQQMLEHDYLVAPGASPDVIRLAFDGARELEIDAQGNLLVHLAGRQIRLSKPVVYQEIRGQRQAVRGSYTLCGHNQVGLDIAAYDPHHALIIDPTLMFATYLGGSGDEVGTLLPDTSGNLYLVGTTTSLNFPVKSPVVQNGFGGGEKDLFVSKITSAGQLVFSTYIGGNGTETIGPMTITNGNVYITGTTSSTDFPTHNAYQAAYGGGTNDAFLLEVSAGGSLQFATYLGGNGQENVSLDTDGAGNLYLSGETTSPNFPTHNGYQNSSGGGAHDCYVAKFNPSGAVQYVTYLGGSGDENGTVWVDAAGNAVAVGTTTSPNFPTKNPIRATYGGGAHDVFVTKLTPAGNDAVFSTYLGGDGDEQTGGSHIDGSGNIFVTGRTWSSNFPVQNAVQAGFGGGTSPSPYLPAPADVFVTKLSSSGALLYSTYLGGSGDESATLRVEDSGNMLLIGSTTSSNFPTHLPAQAAYGGNGASPFLPYGDVFVTRLNSSGQFIFSTYLGGSGLDLSTGAGTDSSGNVYVIGMTSSTDLPTLNAVQPSFGGGSSGGMSYIGDVFVTKYSPTGALLYSTYLGGSGDEMGYGSVDTNGNVLVSGTTDSADYPTHNAVQAAYGGDPHDVFVTRLNPSGQFIFSTFLGGNADESGFAFPTSGGGFLVFGETGSTDFPTASPTQAHNGGATDVFLTKLTDSGSMVYSTYIGGSGDETGLGPMPDGLGHVYVYGITTSPNFPVLNALQSAYGGQDDIFLVKLDEGTGPTCTYTLSATSTNVAASAASGSFKVTAGSGCAWTASSGVSWVHTSSSGTGNGTVSYTVDANSDTSTRNGAITIQGQSFTVNQAGVSCTYTLSAASTNVTAAAASGSFNVNTGPGCPWSASTVVNWIHTSSAGTGPGTASFTIDANSSPSARSSTVNVQGHSFTVHQDGASCTYTLSAASTNVAASAASGSFNVTAASGCAWTASSGVGWIHTSSSGSGNGAASFTVDANSGVSARNGAITVQGQSFTVNQAAAGCSYTLSAASTNVAASATSGSFNVTAASGCAWTASTGSSWIHTSSSGNGNGTVSFTVDANSGDSGRSDTLTVDGQTFTVSQAGTGVRPPAGIFTGVLMTTNGPVSGPFGLLTLTTKSDGSFTAQLTVGTKKSVFKGQFDVNGGWTGVVGTMNIGFHFDAANDRVVGVVGSGSSTARADANRAVYDKTHLVPAGLTGTYTIWLPANTNTAFAGAPQGYGFGSVKVSTSGGISFSATLADGTKVKQTTVLLENNTWQLYVPFKTGGSLGGTVTFAPVAGVGDLGGNVNWSKPGSATGYYPSGFATVLPLVGGRYTTPATGHRLLNLHDATGNAVVLFGFGDLTSPLEVAVTVAANNATTPVTIGADKLSLKFSTTTGQFSGSFVYPTTGKPVKFAGAVLQSQNRGAGYFLGPYTSGFISITPAP